MKKAFSLFLCVGILLLTACGRASDNDAASTTNTSLEIQPVEPVTAQDLLSANDSYGKSKRSGDVLVRDESVLFRTEDSYRLESVAVRAAEEILRSSMMEPDSLQIKDCIVSNCADDGTCAYYDVSFSFSYSVPPDQRIDNDGVYSVGVRKADESTFDASEKTVRILKAYSIFQKTEGETSYTSDANESDAYASAASEIAASHLKNRKTGTVISARPQPDGSGESFYVWEVLCEGENDYGMRIPDVYTVYLVSENGKIIEIDPADPNTNIF